MSNIVQEIKDISKDYLLFSNSNQKMSNIIIYVLSILENIYDKNTIKKYLYPEIIEQIISKEIPYLNQKYKFFLTKNRKKYLKSRIKCLQNKPQNQQRSDQWHEQRKNSIGASELSSVFNKNPFCSYNKFLLKKIQSNEPIEENINKTSSKLNIYCQHGIKYEEIVQKIYSDRNSVTMLEFGSIQDETYTWLRASPDGITTKGTMLEIKVPLKRNIFGLPPIYYWYQMQHQMKVCKLNECDFLECRIEEYNSWNHFLEDSKPTQFHISKTHNLEKGVIIEYINIEEEDPWNKFGYVYPPSIKLDLNEIYKWNQSIKIELNNDANKQYTRIIPWKLIEYSCIKIYRNRHWWNTNFEKINTFWDDVLYYRTNDYKHLIKKRKTKQKKEQIVEYAFIEDL